MLTEPESLLVVVADVLDAAGIRYAVGGSVASSRFGEPRATLDLDVVVELTYGAIPGLVAALTPAFWVDRDAMRSAYQHGTAFQAVHVEWMAKVDFFVAGDDPLGRAQLDRRTALTLPGARGPKEVWFVSAEDIVLQKLRWFRASADVLERQLRDVGGVLRVQGARLDLRYLRTAAPRLGVADLLERALLQAGLRDG